MKKLSLLLLSIFATLALSCSNNDEPQSASILVNVTYNGASASPSVVKLYKHEDAKNFDNSYSGACHFGSTGELLDKKGNIITPIAIGDNTLGVNTFENIPNGRYIVMAFYKPAGYSFANFFYYGYKIIDVEGFLSTHFIAFKTGENAQNVQGFVKL